MKLIIVAAALVALAAAAPQTKPEYEPVPIVRSDFEQTPEGGYLYNFESGDGTKKQEEGQVKTVQDEENKPHDVVIVRGSYSWVDNDGQTHFFEYTADENGFHPLSEDIPKEQVARR